MSSPSLTPSPRPQEPVAEINLGRLLGELLDHYKFIISVTVIFSLFALLYALLSTPVYQAHALIQIEQRQGNTLLNNLSQMLPDSQPQSAPEISLLQSRMILGKTVNELKLRTRVTPRYTPVVGYPVAKLMGRIPGNISIGYFELPRDKVAPAQATLTVLNKQQYRLTGEHFVFEGQVGRLAEQKGASLLILEIDAKPGSQFTLTRVPYLQAITDLQTVFSVSEQGKNTGMLNLQLTGTNPQQIEAVLKNISDNYLAQNINRQAAQDAKSLEFLDTQLPKIRGELEIAEDKLNEYRKQKDSVDLNLEAKSVLEQIVNVDNQLNELTFREAEVSQLYKKDHPTYRALSEKRDTLQKERTRLNKRVSAMPSTQQEVLRLSRDVDSGRAVYLQLLSRQQELNIAKSSAIGNVRIIDDAVTLTKPLKPKKAMIVIAGFMLGGLFAIGFVLLKSALRQGIESPEQLEDCGISVYASVPFSKWLNQNNARKKGHAKNNLLAFINPTDQSIETIRGLRTTMHFAMMEARNNILMISGISPGSGKTFISSNLAAIMAQAEKKVLFIDADMRKGYTHELFDLASNKGLSEILSGQNTFEQVVTTLSPANLDVIPRGQFPPNPAELLMHPRFKAMLDTVSPLYDLVIIDTPPIMAVTDPSIISHLAGTVLMVARYEVNTVKEVIAGIRRFEQIGVPVKGCILNGVTKKTSNYYGYGYSPYGYTYTDSNT